MKTHPVIKAVLDETIAYYDEIEEFKKSTHHCKKNNGHLGPCLMKLGMENYYGKTIEEFSNDEIALLLEHKLRGRFVVTHMSNGKQYFNSRFAGYVNSAGWMELPPERVLTQITEDLSL